MECFKRFRHIDSHFANKQILKGFERSNHRRVKERKVQSSEDWKRKFNSIKLNSIRHEQHENHLLVLHKH